MDPANLRIVRNGPDLDRFRPVPAQPELRRGAAILAVYVGVMNPQDGVDRVICAAEYIVNIKGRKDVRFALLGTGDCLDELRQLARSSGVEAYVDFAGWLDDKDLLAYLSSADICLVPDPPTALNQLSTMTKVMEYMSCGKPIVAFDLLETRYSAGPAAVYVEDDPASFGDAVLELADNSHLRKKLGETGLKRVRTEFHWGRSKDILLECYGHLLDTANITAQPKLNVNSFWPQGQGSQELSWLKPIKTSPHSETELSHYSIFNMLPS